MFENALCHRLLPAFSLPAALTIVLVHRMAGCLSLADTMPVPCFSPSPHFYQSVKGTCSQQRASGHLITGNSARKVHAVCHAMPINPALSMSCGKQRRAISELTRWRYCRSGPLYVRSNKGNRHFRIAARA